MSRISGGCERCRKKRVKCDEARPSCRRCSIRGEACSGYRDVTTLAFRSENEKTARKVATSSAQWEVLPRSPDTSQAENAAQSKEADPDREARPVPQSSTRSLDDKAVSSFLEKFVVCPCNSNSTSGFLEFLPGLFKEVSYDGKFALRWAVLAAGYASLSTDQDDIRVQNTALECYGRALSALGKALADPKVAPDDHVLMSIVILDLFETLHMPERLITGSHAGGMAHILRLRRQDQFQDPRGWSLFRLSHHRWQQQQMTYRQPRQGWLSNPNLLLNRLDDSIPHIRTQKENSEIHSTCERARALLERIDDINLTAEKTLDMITEIRDYDFVAASWRQNPSWTYKTVSRSEIFGSKPDALKHPHYVQLHHDVWTAYEWNYHRTGRIILHRHLLECLERLQSSNQYNPAAFSIDVFLMKKASLDLIQMLVDEILSTVPQSLGDIDNNGKMLKESVGAIVRKGIGGYFLLWPIKILKELKHATTAQRSAARTVFERIRDCTGMKNVLGDMSSI